MSVLVQYRFEVSWVPRFLCFSLWHSQMPSLPVPFLFARFVDFISPVAFVFLPRLHSTATLFRCHSMMDIGDILHGISFTHMCSYSVFGISHTRAQLSWTQLLHEHSTAQPTSQTTPHTHHVHRSLNYEFLFRSSIASIYVIFVSEIEMDDWIAVKSVGIGWSASYR